MRRTAAISIVLATAVACRMPNGSDVVPLPPPSEAAALGYLREVIDVVAAGQLEKLCDLGGGTCRRELAFGRPSVPRTAPRVIGSVEIPTTSNPDGTWNAGGRLLLLCGRDGLGEPYYSEVLVFEDAGRLIGREPVFWTGNTVDTLPAIARPGPRNPCPVP